MSHEQHGNSEAEICLFSALTPGMAVLFYVDQKAASFSGGRLKSRERLEGGGGWDRLVYCVWLFVWEFCRADNKALTK